MNLLKNGSTPTTTQGGRGVVRTMSCQLPYNSFRATGLFPYSLLDLATKMFRKDYVLAVTSRFCPFAISVNKVEKCNKANRGILLSALFPKPAFMPKINNGNNRNMYRICSKLVIKTQKDIITSFWWLYHCFY